MIPFVKPGANTRYPVMAAEAGRLALQHNLGLGGACIVTLYQAC